MKVSGAILVLLCTYATSLGAVSYDAPSFTLTYGDPSDLSTVIDPPGLADVEASFGVSKAAFQALNLQVVAFNGAPASFTNTPQVLVVQYSAAGTVTFNFAAKYNHGGASSYGRSAFSGVNAWDDISTVETQPTIPGYTSPSGTWNAFFDATISSSVSGQGVSALGLCVRAHKASSNPSWYISGGTAFFFLSDGSIATVDYTKFGGVDGDPQGVFIGYQAAAGLTITRVVCTRPGPGNSYVAVDDLSFVMTAPAGVPGDVDGDGHVDVVDLLYLVDAFGSGVGDANYDIRCDFNQDDSVDVVDLLTLVETFGT